MANCMVCHVVPKMLPKHKCYWCGLKAQSTDTEVAAAYRRKHRLEGDTGYASAEWPDCHDCNWLVPEFYMKTKTRCRGCELSRVRDKKAVKEYNMVPGQRQEWFEAQNGKCFGCGSAQKVTGLALHHSHYDGTPYYLACLTCNHDILGTAFDNPNTLLRLALGQLYPPHTPGNLEKINKLIWEIANGA